jgi:hypothetical protein
VAIRRRANPAAQETIRARIDGSRLAKMLNDHAFGEVEMTDEQRDSAKFLLTRCISPPVPKDDDGKTPKVPIIIAWQ